MTAADPTQTFVENKTQWGNRLDRDFRPLDDDFTPGRVDPAEDLVEDWDVSERTARLMAEAIERDGGLAPPVRRTVKVTTTYEYGPWMEVEV